MENKVTTGLIMSWRPCRIYTANRVGHLIKEGKTAKECLDLGVDYHDILWLLTHYYEHVSPSSLSAFMRFLCAYRLTEKTFSFLKTVDENKSSLFCKAFAKLTCIALDPIWNKEYERRFSTWDHRKQVVSFAEQHLCMIIVQNIERELRCRTL